MSVAADVLMTVYRRAAGNTARVVSFREIGEAAALGIDELRSAVRVLELEGLLVWESDSYRVDWPNGKYCTPMVR